MNNRFLIVPAIGVDGSTKYLQKNNISNLAKKAAVYQSYSGAGASTNRESSGTIKKSEISNFTIGSKSSCTEIQIGLEPRQKRENSIIQTRRQYQSMGIASNESIYQTNNPRKNAFLPNIRKTQRDESTSDKVQLLKTSTLKHMNTKSVHVVNPNMMINNFNHMRKKQS